MTTPALRHETGDLLAVKQVRVHGEMEKALMHPIPAEGSLTSGIAQSSSAFQGTHLGFGAAMGVHPKAELQFSSYWLGRGAGWRVGAKTPLTRAGRFSVAGLLRLGTYSGGGDIELLDSTGALSNVEYALSAKQIDLGVPVSTRFGAVTAYSGLALIKSWVRGTAGGAPVSDTSTDLVFNLGARFPIWGPLEADTELAVVRAGERFTQSTQMLTFYGFGVGSTF